MGRPTADSMALSKLGSSYLQAAGEGGVGLRVLARLVGTSSSRLMGMQAVTFSLVGTSSSRLDCLACHARWEGLTALVGAPNHPLALVHPLQS